MGKWDRSTNTPQLYVRWKYDILRRRYNPRRYPLPAPATGIFDAPTVCFTVNEGWFSHVLGALSVLTQDDSWLGDDTEQYRALQEMEKLINSIAPCAESTRDCPPSSGGGVMAITLLDCIQLADNDGDGVYETVNINECEGDCMAVVNIYECGCGCGDSGGKTAATGTGTTGTTGTTGAYYDTGLGVIGDGVGGATGITKCDIASYLIPYALDQAREWFQAADDFIRAGGNIVDFLEEGSGIIDPASIVPTSFSLAKAILEGTAGGIEQIIETLGDSDFVLRYQESWWRSTTEDNAMPGRVTAITRQDLLRGNRYAPLFWGAALDGVIVLPRVVLDLFWRIINLEKLNNRLVLAEGQANATLCTYLASTIGDTYEAPTSTSTYPSGLIDFTSGSGVAYQIALATNINMRTAKVNTAPPQYRLPPPLQLEGGSKRVYGGGFRLLNVNMASPVPQENIFSVQSYNVNHISYNPAPLPFSEEVFIVEGYADVFTAVDIENIQALVANRIGAYTADYYYTPSDKTSWSDGYFFLGNVTGYRDENGADIDVVWIIYEV